MHRLSLAFILLGLLPPAGAQDGPVLTVDLITQDPETWIGAWPTDAFWTDDGAWVYVRWNPQGQFESDSLFKARAESGELVQLTAEERRNLPPRFQGWHADRLAYDAAFTRRVFDRDGDLFVYDLAADGLLRLTRTSARESGPRFSPDGHRVIYQQGDQLFALDLETGATEQRTDLREGTESADDQPSEQDAYLQAQQTRLFDVLRERARRDSLQEAAAEREDAVIEAPPTFYVGDKSVRQLQLDPTERFVTFTLSTRSDATQTRLVDYVTASGYAEEINARAKVGSPSGDQTLYVQDLARDTTIAVDLTTLPGATDAPDYARERGETTDSTRQLVAFGPYWRSDGRFAVLDVRTRDNKDRWIARLDPETGDVTSLDRQRDEAWIAGPGIAWWGGASSVGWMVDGRFWFQSERTGYSHLYAVEVETGEVTALTSGTFEVSNAQLSKGGATWTFQSSEGSPHERHVYRMDADGGARTRLTRLPGRNDFALSPDERWLALLYSQSNRPPEVVVEPAAPVTPGGRQRPIRMLTNSPTDDWLAYPWQEPEIITIPASDGVQVPARIYRPENPNGAAVFFVHGAGYLQNVHRWWSGYFREYMFHHLLAEQGYLVLDLDYRASAGYGRDWRTAIYRHMGGRDLQDYVDASRWVGDEFGIPGERVAIYGGSYGGFLTLMALFTAPEHFGGGAALRSVTDWAHYNHVYTANILNTPTADSLAYARSSPIEFAAGLEDPLLMTHGLVDDNVQPQDIFRLSQRLIELGKRDWELAIAPVEPHGYREPTSWADKLHRILDLIEHSVGPLRSDESEG
ncbi:MAG: prolyl oligopeptidase family serine peptidase [Rhodothermaceae bacterium]|nr:prolyl oligopeptidase family serine peptidase [Rhodothermaceae bacterium]